MWHLLVFIALFTAAVSLSPSSLNSPNRIWHGSNDSNLPSQLSKSVKSTFSYAVDLSIPLSLSQFQCIRQAGYATAFVRVYQPTGAGQADPYGCTNILNAFNAGMGVEIYATPQPQGTKQGYQQFDETFSALTTNGITVRTIWLQVTSPINWPNDQQSNANFISSFISRARSRGIAVGIYTSWYDWQQITGSWSGWQNGGPISLWYWNTYGQGVPAETQANFEDFRSFGGWSQPAVKQFGLTEQVCSITVNRDTYVTGTRKADGGKSSKGPVVGMLWGDSP